MPSYIWYRRKYSLSNGFCCIYTFTSVSMEHNLKTEDWWKRHTSCACLWSACNQLYFRRYVLWYWWNQFKGDLRKTVIQMLYEHTDRYKSKLVSPCSLTIMSVCIYYVSYVFYWYINTDIFYMSWIFPRC